MHSLSSPTPHPPLPLQHPCSLVWSGEGSALFVCLQSQIHCITVQEGIPPLAQLSREPYARVSPPKTTSQLSPFLDTNGPTSNTAVLRQCMFPCQSPHCPHGKHSEECQFTLNLEHCSDVIPLLKGVLTVSKLLPFSSHCHIKPASRLMFCAKSELWTAPPPPCPLTPSFPRIVMNRKRTAA